MLRVSSLDYLGIIASRLRKDAVRSAARICSIDGLITEIKQKEIEDLPDEEVKSKVFKL